MDKNSNFKMKNFRIKHFLQLLLKKLRKNANFKIKMIYIKFKEYIYKIY